MNKNQVKNRARKVFRSLHPDELEKACVIHKVNCKTKSKQIKSLLSKYFDLVDRANGKKQNSIVSPEYWLTKKEQPKPDMDLKYTKSFDLCLNHQRKKLSSNKGKLSKETIETYSYQAANRDMERDWHPGNDSKKLLTEKPATMTSLVTIIASLDDTKEAVTECREAVDFFARIGLHIEAKLIKTEDKSLKQVFVIQPKSDRDWKRISRHQKQ